MKQILKITAIAGLLFLGSCGDKGGDSSGGNGNGPEASILITPLDNSECTTGTTVSATQSKVAFQWNASEGAATYLLNVKNLATQTSLQYSAGNSTSTEVTLIKGVPYSWYVVAKNDSGDTTPSAVWKFYNSGEGIENYAPFPAEVVTPLMSSSVSGSTVTLEWNADDLDGDIFQYKVYFGTAVSPTTLLSTVTQQSIANVAVSANTNYYWKVVAIDAAGNSSVSPIFQFKAE